MNWGDWADHKPESEPEPNPSREDVWHAVRFIHREIVNLKDRYGYGSIDSREISKSLNFGGSSKSFQAVLDLNLPHFDDKPLNSKKVVKIADRLRQIDPSYWFELIRDKKNIFDEEVDV